MTIHFTLFNAQATFIFAGYYSFGTVILDVLFHSIQSEGNPALQKALYDSVWALLFNMLIDIFPQDLAARTLKIIIRIKIIVGAG